jgi:hypothetical protein
MFGKLKYLFYLVLLCFLVGGVWYAGYHFSLQKRYVTEDATVVLERIEKVCKLVTVEGHISEIYNYKDYYFYDVWPLRKKALVRVRATVSIGYDFEKLSIKTDAENKTISIKQFPDPEVLYLDHNLDYYDLSEGVFNVFTEEDYTKLNKKVREFIESKALESDLFLKAREQEVELFETIQFMARGMGWQVQIEEVPPSLEM